MTFTKVQQEKHRQEFIDDCRNKAWGAACNASWIGQQVEKLVTDYTKLKAEDETLGVQIGQLEHALDYHTVENREKRKALQEHRNGIAKQMGAFNDAIRESQRGLDGLHQSIEANLALAKHAETWEWNEISQ